ncbi:single-stranded-DNA-specific exonuclease RecJ, partial [bacterium]|nr:single-stranded-DNA-specific exonuclease RecJ [bacterium]
MKQWEIAKSNDELKKSLSSKINISKTVAQILINRGLTNEDEALAFLSPSLKDLPDPALLPDMERGCKAIIEALEQSKKITIYGDYDVDGLTSTALLYKFLKQLNADVDYYIPSRLDEGYGLNKNAIKELKQRETSLIITVDNGSKATDEV